jgi:hypothetical protein
MSKGKKRMKAYTAVLVAMLFVLLSTMLTSAAPAALDLVSPANNSYSNQQAVAFDYYISMENQTITQCNLSVDSIVVNSSSNITNGGFNQLKTSLSMGSHSWSITCNSDNSTENNTVTSEERLLKIDILAPTIVPFFPLNNSIINASSANISFVAVDDSADNISCDIMLNNTINKSLVAKDSEPTWTLLGPLSDGGYNWMIICRDYANNSKSTDIRGFSINTTPATPLFGITIPKTQFNVGENVLMSMMATNGTSLRVEVCPNQAGFVQCAVPVNAQNIQNYPFQEYLPFTNYAGQYVLEAFFNYSGFTETQGISYDVVNDIAITINTDVSQRRNVPVELEAEAAGGVGAKTYLWYLSNGSIVNRSKANITYGTTGDYTNIIVVKDSYNNTKNKSITVTVDNTVLVNVAVKDSKTNAAIPDATVEIDDDDKTTDANGQASYYVRPGRQDIIVLKDNYKIYDSELNVTGDQTFTILLEPIETQEIIVNLRYPANQSGIAGPTTDLVFNATYSSNLNCSVYINENNDGFFIYLGSMDVSSSAAQTFGVMDLENKSYWWKVECTGKNGKNNLSQAWMFTVGNAGTAPALVAPSANQTAQPSGNYQVYNDWIKSLEQVLSNINNLPPDAKEAANALGISEKVDESIGSIKNTIRDLDALQFRKDLSDPDKQAEGERIIKEADVNYQRTPISIELLSSSGFVDYIKADELKGLYETYISEKNMTSKVDEKAALKFLDELQQEVVISTKVKVARITFTDGTQTDASIVIREIKVYNITSGTFLLEVIPKDVIEDAKDIMSSQAYTIVKQDPIIRFDIKGDTVISYYVEAKLDEEALKKIKTAVFVEPDSIAQDDKITGFSISNVKLPGIKNILFIPLIIVLLGGLVFAGIRYDGITTARFALYNLYGKRSLHYISVVLNEIHDNISAGDINKAHELYDEAKGAYAELSDIAKNDVYDDIVEAAERIKGYNDAMESQSGITDIKIMLDQIQEHMSSGQLVPTLEIYKSIESSYNQLGGETKEMLHPTLVSLGNKIQIMIENNNKLI